MFSYTEQLAWVRWGRSSASDTFSVRNGTRQGSVASPTFWSLYLNPLIEELRANGVGCHVAGMFVGVCAYADDLVLLAPNRCAAQHMLATCERFANMNNTRFSTNDDPAKSKSKALHMIGVKGTCDKPVPLVLCGKELPWVETCEHLGSTLHVSGSMETDCKMKRAQFISDAVKVRENFHFAHPLDVIEATEKYCSSHYRSNLWFLRGEAATMLYSSWKTNTKLVWDLPRKCRSFFIEPLAPGITPPLIS